MGNICDIIVPASKSNKENTNNANRTGQDDAGSIVEKRLSSVTTTLGTDIDKIKGEESSLQSVYEKNKDLIGRTDSNDIIPLLPGVHIRLLEHQHSLFCERKQRVCGAIGKLQELEFVQVEGLERPPPDCVWLRSPKKSLTEKEASDPSLVIPGTEKLVKYQLKAEDVGCYIFFKYLSAEIDHPHLHQHLQTTPETESGEAFVSSSTEAAATTPRVDRKVVDNSGRDAQQTVAGVEPASEPADVSSADASVSLLASPDDVQLLGADEVPGAEGGEGQVSNSDANEGQVVSVSTKPASKQQQHAVPPGSDIDNASNEEQKETIINKTTAELTIPSAATGSGPETGTGTQAAGMLKYQLAENTLGPVLPGPPRLTDMKIRGVCKTGKVVRAEVDYIGGLEGASEYWWIKIDEDGKRVQLTEAKTCKSTPIRRALINNNNNSSKTFSSSSSAGTGTGTGMITEDEIPAEEDIQVEDINDLEAKYYIIREDDVGCQLKVKCRPVRSDGFVGEVFTSKPSAVIFKEDASTY